jgi:DNA polymerase-3 subunit alpha
MKLIQSFGTDAYQYPGEYPAPCVVEGDDGFRILIHPTPDIPKFIADAAKTLGVEMTIIEEPHEAHTHKGTFPIEGHPSYSEVADRYHTEADEPTFVHIHTHSEFSSLDGFSTIPEIVACAVADNQPAVAVTDHGTCAAHPHLQAECDDAGIKPIFGLEAYFVDDRHRRPLERTKPKKENTEEEEAVFKADQAAVKDYWHLVLIAMNDTGLRNLWAMSTEASRDGFYYHPRLDWDTLERYSEGIICTTACLRGPVSRAILQDDMPMARIRMSRLQDIFGDRLYAEVHTNHLEDQFKVNAGIVKLADEMNVPCIAVVDSHYSCCEHKDAHHVWIAAQTSSNINEEAGLFDSDENYHLMTRDEVMQALLFSNDLECEEWVENTVKLADRCTARLAGDPSPPKFGATHDADFETLFAMCEMSWQQKCQGNARPEQEYADRFEREMKLLVAKNLCGYFDIVADYCLWAKRQGILVGPGRGSGGASLVAYLSGITEIDPVDAELPFERFLTPGRTELPDFDIDFPPSRIDEVIQYVTDKWGERCVVRVGSHIRLKSKGVLKNLAMTLRGKHDIDFGDLEAIGKIIDAAEKNTAGLGLSWEELWNQNEDDLRPWAVKYPEIFAYAETMVGRLKSYGKHAAGFIISSDVDLTDTLPLRKAGEQLVAEFDMRALAEIGLVKFDFLSVRNLDTLQQCVDLIRERTGEEIDLYSWKDEYDDQDVWDFISAGNTLGCFQIETNAGTMMTKAVQPRNLHDMADVTTLDRPGPMRSKLDVQYLDRRHGRAPVSYADPRLEKVLHRTFGVMLYQEDIMGICRELAGYDEEEADYVRKILGKKKVAEAEKEGRKFIPACVERGLSQAAAEAIWSQMFEFSRYSFNKAHAYAYGMISYWCAWFSYHYPTEFFVAAMSTVDSDRIPAFVIGAENRGCQVLPPDINDSGRGFAAKGNVIRFGLDAIKGVGEAGVKWLLDHQPYTTFEEFMDAKPNMAVAKPVVRAGAFDSIVPNRKQLEGIIVQYETEEINRCVHWNPDKVGAPNGLPCEFRWDLRVPEIGKKGRPLKLPDISKKCTVVCKHYEKRTSLSTIEVEPYSDGEIQEIETELFGIYLTSSPFESIPEDIREQLWTARDLDANVVGSKGIAAAIVKEVTQTKDRNQKSMAFVSLFFGDGDEKAVCFQKQWGTYKRYLRPNQLVFVQLEKTTRGFTILDVQPATGVK